MPLAEAIESFLLEQQLRNSPPAAREFYRLNLTILVPARSGQGASGRSQLSPGGAADT